MSNSQEEPPIVLEEKTEHTGEDTAVLEVAVPRGWRDFLYAYPRWKDQDPEIKDSLSEELRSMVRAEVVMLINEIAVSRPDMAAALVEQYSLQDLVTSVRRNEKEPLVPPTAPKDISHDEALQAIVKHIMWLADRLPVGGIVPIGGDIGIMVLEKADLEAGTPAKTCNVRRTADGWSHLTEGASMSTARGMAEPITVTKEEVRAIEAQYECALGMHLPIGKKMVERGIWKIEKN